MLPAMPVKLDDLTVKTALYHHERGRVYRPSRLELEANRFSCPRCGTDLLEVRIRLQETALSCPKCQWSIHRQDLWQPQLEQEPDVRAPGEATQDDPALADPSIAALDSVTVADTVAPPVLVLS